jgi:hypothetical protein
MSPRKAATVVSSTISVLSKYFESALKASSS